MDDYTNSMAPQPGFQEHNYGLAPQPAYQPAEPPASHDASGNIDKIRDILFGANMRDYEHRFSRLEEALRKESADLRENTRRHLEALEAFVHKEIASLQSRITAERDERSESHARLSSELSASSAAILKKIGEFESQEASAKSDIRNNLLQQSKDLNDAIRQKADELNSLLERRFAELHHSKTDRAGLASLFSEVALRLSDQFKVPGVE